MLQHKKSQNGYWKGRTVCVTGAAGLLGSWLVKALIEQQAQVMVIVRDLVPESLFFTDELSKKVTVVFGDVTDREIIQRVLNEYNIETVFHLGAQAIVGYANRSPISTFESNIKGTWQVLEACRLSPWVKRIVVASSDKAYGEQAVLPYTENSPLQGKFPYDVSKSCADLIAQSYFHAYKLPVCITRCGNFFGGGDLHFNRIVPGTIKSILEGKAPIIRSNGLLIRDYIYVKDVVDAYLTLAEYMENSSIVGQAFNFSTDQPFSVLHIVSLIQQLMGSNMQPIIENGVSCEIHEQHLNSEKAYRTLGWQASYGVQAGLIETIDWYTNFFAGNKQSSFLQEACVIPAKSGTKGPTREFEAQNEPMRIL